MDCNTGAQMGRQFNKDVMMFQGNITREPGAGETDTLMQMPVMGGAGMMHPMAGVEWAQAFHNAQSGAALWQANQMEQAFLASQQSGMGPMVGSPLNVNQHPQQHMAMMSGMMAANLGVGMMMPRSQYQTTPLTITQTPQTETLSVLNTTNNPQEDWTRQLEQQEWCKDYSSVENFILQDQAASTVEEKTKNSEFYALMDQIRNRELLIDEEKGELVAGPGPEPEVHEDMEYLRNWAQKEGLNMPESVFHPQPKDEQAIDGIDGNQEIDDWAREYMETQRQKERAAIRTDYPFEPNNPYVHHENPFEDGHQMLELGNLADAALAFEAVCQRENENFEAWHLLGTTQANNEKDSLAIIALNNARRINPRSREVHVALSVSHTNEHNPDAAIDCLKQWLLNHPEYDALAQTTFEPAEMNDLDINDAYFFSDPVKMREVVTLYQAALEMNPNDADLYTNLGILYNISHDFDLAAKNFRRTAELRPNDPKVWNKLGATLANGSRPEEAIEAYQRALDVNPGYVRAMFNLAVAYNNVGKYPLAARHVVRALAMQQGGTDPKGEGNLIATRGMWDLLRMSLNLMDRQDLVDLTYKMDLAPLIKEFGLEHMV